MGWRDGGRRGGDVRRAGRAGREPRKAVDVDVDVLGGGGLGVAVVLFFDVDADACC